MKALLQQCLKAIKLHTKILPYNDSDYDLIGATIAAIKAELEKPVEPVAYILPKGLEMLKKRGTFTSVIIFAKDDDALIPLYTRPPRQQKPLSDDEIKQFYESTGYKKPLEKENTFAAVEFVRAIEAKHEIK